MYFRIVAVLQRASELALQASLGGDRVAKISDDDFKRG
jgi:hypothetical protein